MLLKSQITPVTDKKLVGIGVKFERIRRITGLRLDALKY